MSQIAREVCEQIAHVAGVGLEEVTSNTTMADLDLGLEEKIEAMDNIALDFGIDPADDDVIEDWTSVQDFINYVEQQHDECEDD